MVQDHSGLKLLGPVHDTVGPGNAGDVFASQGAGNIPAWTHPSDLAVDYGLAFIGTVTGIAGAPNFQCSGLIGFGDNFFKDYWSYVVWNQDTPGAAPQGEILQCTGYSSATGDFTVAVYTVAIAVGDKVLLLHPSIASLVNTTYGLAALKVLIDDIEAKLDTGGLGKGLVTKALTFTDQTGQVNLFTVTGDVIVRIVAVVKTNCASGGCNVSVGIATDVDAIIPVTDITLLAAQEIWHDATPDTEIEALGSMRDHIITGGNDITLNSSAADNSGAVTFYCFWTALSSGATVVAA